MDDIQFEYLCRICLKLRKQNEIMSIYDVAHIIMSFTSIKISENDKLPNSICNKCREQAKSAYEFKALCESSDRFLRENSDKPNDELEIETNVCEENLASDICDDANSLHDESVNSDENGVPNTDCDKIDKYECTICKRIFKNELRLKKHELAHTTIAKCEKCGKEFATKRQLHSHISSHERKGAHLCPICGKQFTLPENLAVHQRRHAGIKPHKCNLCNKSFTQSNELKSHMISHTNEKTYLCNFCGNKYTRKVSLEVHIRRMHLNSGIVYSCSICQRTFKDKQDLGIHKLIHSGQRKFVCLVCNKAFNRNSNLKVHERIHTGHKPFTCHICQKSFIQKHVLTAHLRTHPDMYEIKREK